VYFINCVNLRQKKWDFYSFSNFKSKSSWFLIQIVYLFISEQKFSSSGREDVDVRMLGNGMLLLICSVCWCKQMLKILCFLFHSAFYLTLLSISVQ